MWNYEFTSVVKLALRIRRYCYGGEQIPTFVDHQWKEPRVNVLDIGLRGDLSCLILLVFITPESA
jgi:hypothetical protein